MSRIIDLNERRTNRRQSRAHAAQVYDGETSLPVSDVAEEMTMQAPGLSGASNVSGLGDMSYASALEMVQQRLRELDTEEAALYDQLDFARLSPDTMALWQTAVNKINATKSVAESVLNTATQIRDAGEWVRDSLGISGLGFAPVAVYVASAAGLISFAGLIYATIQSTQATREALSAKERVWRDTYESARNSGSTNDEAIAAADHAADSVEIDIPETALVSVKKIAYVAAIAAAVWIFAPELRRVIAERSK